MSALFADKAYAAFKIRDFRLFISARFFLTLALQMQSVIVGWQVYALTKDPFSLGLIGLAEAVPFLGMALYAGHVADKFARKKIILVSTCLYFVCALVLLGLSLELTLFKNKDLLIIIYGVIFLSGLARAFFYPSQSALMAQIVPRELYVNSSTWNSTVWHIAAVTGPAIGGLVYGFWGQNFAYSFVIVFAAISLVLFFYLKQYPVPKKSKVEPLLDSLKAGLKFVMNKKVILGAMALDMLAVLFGGAVAMLPVFAAEVLKTGPEGLGLLRAAPALGAVLMSFILAYNPPLRMAGKKLLTGVAGFGLCMIFFALSTNFWLSFLLLALSGVFDNISVIIRGSILQIFTPDEMRGRVASVNSIFIGSSNEIGSFESGLAARIMGLIPSVVFGGCMTIVVVTGIGRFVPAVRTLDLRQDALNRG
ncbi:MAG: MFS transporter [Bacteroidota bacterium]